MELSIRYLLELRDISGVKQEVLTVDDGISVEDLLGELLGRYPGMKSILTDKRTGALLPRVKVLVNGRDVRFGGGLQTKLAAGDLVSVLPAMR